MSHDPHDGMSSGASALLRHAPKRRALAPPPERARTTAAVRRVAATPFIAASVWLSWKGIALAAALLLAGGLGATRWRGAGATVAEVRSRRGGGVETTGGRAGGAGAQSTWEEAAATAVVRVWRQRRW